MKAEYETPDGDVTEMELTMPSGNDAEVQRQLERLVPDDGKLLRII